MYVNTAVWVCRMFVEWDFIIPFDWILKIPYESNGYRECLLCYFLVTYGSFLLLGYVFNDINKNHGN